MSNIVNFTGGNLPTAKSLSKGLANARSELRANDGPGGTLLRLTKQGDWVYGAESTDLEEGVTAAINPYSISHGWILWEDGSVAGEEMVSIEEARPPKPGPGWNEQYAIQLKVLSGLDEGEELLYKGTSLGLKKAFSKIVEAVEGQLNTSEDEIVPIVSFGVDSYRHKQYGKIFTPILTVEGWMNMGGEKVEVEEKADDKKPAPTRRRRRS